MEALATPNSWVAVILVALVGGVVANFLTQWLAAAVGLASTRVRQKLVQSNQRKVELVERMAANPALLAAMMSSLAVTVVVYCYTAAVAGVTLALAWMVEQQAGFLSTPGKDPGQLSFILKGLGVLAAARSFVLQYDAAHVAEICHEAWGRLTRRPELSFFMKLRELVFPIGAVIIVAWAVIAGKISQPRPINDKAKSATPSAQTSPSPAAIQQ
jgi:hypothetical protein